MRKLGEKLGRLGKGLLVSFVGEKGKPCPDRVRHGVRAVMSQPRGGAASIHCTKLSGHAQSTDSSFFLPPKHHHFAFAIASSFGLSRPLPFEREIGSGFYRLFAYARLARVPL